MSRYIFLKLHTGPNLVFASEDRIALDVEGIKIIRSYPGNSLSKEPWEYEQIRVAAALGLGVGREEDYLVLDS